MSALARVATNKTSRTVLPSADTLFRQGKDTLEISIVLGLPEDEVLRRLSVQRSRRLQLREPYGASA